MGTGLIPEKKEVLYSELNEKAGAATSSYSATSNFLQYIYSVLVAKNHQGVSLMNFLSQIFVNDINHGYRAAILKNISWWLPKYLPYQFVNADCPYLMPDAMEASEEIGRLY